MTDSEQVSAPLVVHRQHDVVLQTLNREHEGLFLTEGAYAPTVDKWEGVPVIYANDHINPTAYDADPAAELARVGGKVVGAVKAPRIERVGHPNLRGKLAINDPTLEAMIADGRVTPSTAFHQNPSDPDPRKLSGPISPHHVLLFREGGPLQPGDRGALILNAQRRDNMTDENETRWQALKTALMAFLQPARVPDPDPQQPTQDRSKITPENTKLAMLEKEVADYKTTVEQAQKEARTFKADLEAATAKLAEFEKSRKDANWASFKAKVPKGMLAKEDEARADYEKDPGAFATRVIEFIASRPNPGGEEGAEHTPPPPPPADPDAPYLTVEAPVAPPK